MRARVCAPAFGVFFQKRGGRGYETGGGQPRPAEGAHAKPTVVRYSRRACGSYSWRVWRHKASVFIGGARRGLLEMICALVACPSFFAPSITPPPSHICGRDHHRELSQVNMLIPLCSDNSECDTPERCECQLLGLRFCCEVPGYPEPLPYPIPLPIPIFQPCVGTFKAVVADVRP